MKNFHLMMASQLNKLPAQFATEDHLMCICIQAMGGGSHISKITRDDVLDNKFTIVDAYLINITPEDVTYLTLMGITVRSEISRNNIRLNEIYDKGSGMHY